MNGQVEKAIDKVRKLLKVADSGATGNGVEHEQETALRQALAIMAKHNLSMADIEEVEEKEDRDNIEIAEEFPCPWRRVLAGAVAKLFFCTFVFIKVPNKQKYKFIFVGLESNAITAKEMTQYLIKSVFKESYRQQKERNETVAFGTTFRNAAANRIAVRCNALMEEAQADTSLVSGRALTLTSVYEQEEKLNLNYIDKVMGMPLVEKKIKGEYKSRSGLAAGTDYGNKVNLNRQLSAPKATAPTLSLGMS